MAKKAPSKHSRAARRATSPGIDTDKSLKNVKPPEESVNFRPAVLSMHQAAGVTKKSKSGRKSALSSRARRRHEKGMDRAAAVMDRTANKIQKSRSQSRTIQERSKTWDAINALVSDVPVATASKTKKQLQAKKEQEAVDDFFREDRDEEMEETAAAPRPGGVSAPPVPAAPPEEGEIGIL